MSHSTSSQPPIPSITFTSAPALEVRVLGAGQPILQAQLLAELEELKKTAPAGETWRLETRHEFFALASPYSHKNAKGAHSYDDSIERGWYWAAEETPWYEGGRVVVGFNGGNVSYAFADYRAFARAVRVAGQ